MTNHPTVRGERQSSSVFEKIREISEDIRVGHILHYHRIKMETYSDIQFCSVTQSCPTLCDLMDCNTSGFPVHHQLPEPTQTHVHSIMMPSTQLILCHPLLLPPSIFPSMRAFQMSRFFASGGQSIGVSASASVLPMNIQN